MKAPGPLPAIVPAPVETHVRCPLAAATPRFPEAETVRCVLDDTHRGVCKLIDGYPLVAVPLEPHERYAVMGLAPPARLVHASAERVAGRIAAGVSVVVWGGLLLLLALLALLVRGFWRS